MRRSSRRSLGRRNLTPSALVLLASLVLGTVLTGAPAARVGTARQTTTPPTISGMFNQGSTLTASSGTWSFTPTSITYQWQRCDSDGSNCNDLRGATASTYTLVTADVTHTVVVIVTASNINLVNDAMSDPSAIIDSTNGPVNPVRPAISGTAQVGQNLSVSNGTWIPAASTFSYQWQFCAGDGSDCLNIPGATKSIFHITSDAISHTLRTLVAAQTAGGDIATVPSNTTGKVPGAGTTNTSTTTTTATVTATTPTTTAATGLLATTLLVLALRRGGARIYASFRVCAGPVGPVTITERDTKGKARAQTRRFTVNVTTCANVSHDWPLLARFRSAGRFVVTAQARDQTGALSKPISRSLVFH